MSFFTNLAPPGANSDGNPDVVSQATAVLDSAHLGDITGAFGTLRRDDAAPRRTWLHRVKTLLCILGPGLIVMIGDNDAGGVATYTQAGQNYGTHLLWTLLALAPVLYLNQEMVLRLGAVSGVGHARLIFERFGRFWGAFSVIDLFVLNTLTIVTEFVGVNLALTYFGLSKYVAVPLAVALLLVMPATGKFARWERGMMVLIIPLNLILIPYFFLTHPVVAPIARGTFVPNFPGGLNSTLLLLITAIVGTTVAPWQLFFQQSNVVDKRITARWVPYERVDTLIGCFLVIVGGGIFMTAAAFGLAHTHVFGNYVDPLHSARSLRHYVGSGAGALLAIALLDLSLIGASAVTLSTSYTLGDVFKTRHSLHWKVSQAKGFYAVFAGSIIASAALVLIPHVPLGTLTVGVQALAGILLPSATVFLLLLCNDKAVLGPWVNTTKRNIFTGVVIWILVLLSIALTAATLFSNISSATLKLGFLGGAGVGIVGGTAVTLLNRRQRVSNGPTGRMDAVEVDRYLPWRERRSELRERRANFRMPPLSSLTRPLMSTQRRVGLTVLRSYLLVAFALAIVKIAEVASGSH